jgi:DNA-binding IclR family transcriptional regulator
MLGTIQKASHVLSLFTEAKSEWGVTEIAQLLNEPKSTVHELLSSLAQLGWLARTDKGRYRLGSAFFGYSLTALRTWPHRDDIHRVLQGLAERFGEMAQVGVLVNGEVLSVDIVIGPNRAGQLPTPVGAIFPAHALATGKVLLAHEPWDKVHEHLSRRGLNAYTQNTVTQFDQLQTELAQVQQQGYAISQSEFMRDWSAVAAPIRGKNGVIASVSTLVSASRFPMLSNELLAAVISAANTLSKTFGYEPAPVVQANPLAAIA